MSLRELTAGRPLLGTFGPVDLSVDLGTPGQPDSVPMRTAAAAIEAAALRHSVPMGIFAGSPQAAGNQTRFQTHLGSRGRGGQAAASKLEIAIAQKAVADLGMDTGQACGPIDPLAGLDRGQKPHRCRRGQGQIHSTDTFREVLRRSTESCVPQPYCPQGGPTGAGGPLTSQETRGPSWLAEDHLAWQKDQVAWKSTLLVRRPPCWKHFQVQSGGKRRNQAD